MKTDFEFLKDSLLQRFIQYVKMYTQSDSSVADSGRIPSTLQQWDLAKYLQNELISFNLQDVKITENCYVYAYLPSNIDECTENVCFLAHIDTVEEVSGKNVNPQVIKYYDGKDISLKNDVILSCKNDKYLKEAAENKETIITTDGTTLLGGDDKAGIAAIMTMLEYFYKNPELPHIGIEVIFSPDEETGHGMDKVPLELLKSKFAYTVDGGHVGEMESECFNAFCASITFYGKSTHTGNARENKMINAILMASNFIQNLPHNMLPETTDNYQGFIAPLQMDGTVEEAHVYLLLRSFSMDEIETQKNIINSNAQLISNSFNSKVQVEFNQQYLNMKETLDKNPQVLEKLKNAYKNANVTPIEKPIRGGTDGSRLTEMGIPTPNIFTGGHNFHSKQEWVSLNQMLKSTEVLINVAKK